MSANFLKTKFVDEIDRMEGTAEQPVLTPLQPASPRPAQANESKPFLPVRFGTDFPLFADGDDLVVGCVPDLA